MASASNGATTTATSHSAVAVIEPPESASSSSHHHLPYTNGGRERGVATTAAAAPTVTKGVVVGDRRAREKEEEEDNEDDEELRPTPITRSNTLHLSVGAESDDDDEDDCEEDEQQHSHRGRRHHQGGGGGGRQEGGSRRRMRAALTEWQKANAPSYSPAEADLMILPQHDSDDFGECVYSPSRSRDAFRGGDDDFPLSRSPPFEPHSLPPEVFVLEEEMGGLACPPGVGGAGCSPVRPPPVRPPPNNAREAFQLQVQDALEVTSGERMFAHCDTNLIEEVWMEKKPKIVHGYLFGRVIGEGSYAKVKEVVEEETLVRRAVKIIKGTRLRKIQNGLENVEREINILKKIHHPNVIQLIESFRDHSKNKLYMIFGFCISSLQQILDANPEKKMGEGEALYYFRQLLKGRERLAISAADFVSRAASHEMLIMRIDGMGKHSTKLPALIQRPKSIDDVSRQNIDLYGVQLSRLGEDGHQFFNIAMLNIFEAYGGGSHQACSYLLHSLNEIETIPRRLVILADNAAMMKSKVIHAFYGWVLLNLPIDEITAVHFAVGHTHCEVDAFFGSIVKRLRQHNAYTPEDMP